MAVARLHLSGMLHLSGGLDAVVLDVLAQEEPILLAEELRRLGLRDALRQLELLRHGHGLRDVRKRGASVHRLAWDAAPHLASGYPLLAKARGLLYLDGRLDLERARSFRRVPRRLRRALIAPRHQPRLGRRGAPSRGGRVVHLLRGRGRG